MTVKVYNQKGEVSDSVRLDEKLFNLPWRADLVSQVIRGMQANRRLKVALAKDRGAVAGGGKKPWRQKGTGRARHGSIRSPLWIGGGVTHGPTAARDYSQKINKKAKTQALFIILSKKLKDGEILLVDKISFTSPKTKIARESLNNFSKIAGFEKINYKKGKRALIITAALDNLTVKSFRNLASTKVLVAKDLDPLTAATYKYLVILSPKESLSAIIRRADSWIEKKIQLNQSQPVKELITA